MKARIDCKYFNGYKPCGRNENCDSSCSVYVKSSGVILLIHLGALGAVVRSTALLQGLRRKHPQAKIIWLTDKPAHHILQGHPELHQVLTTDYADILSLKSYHFEAAYVVDKSLKATGILAEIKTQAVYGFKALNGAIVPATEAANELWSLGLSDQKKFFENNKSEVHLMYEALELEAYKTQDYHLPLSAAETFEAQRRAHLWREDSQWIVGLNTGCSHVIPAKKLTVDFQRELIVRLKNVYGKSIQIVLLGGPEDTVRNQQIADGLDVVVSATESGLRDGLISVAACDFVLTGDSLGMHMAISQKKYVIAWFGPTCAHEIELYGRGEALLAQVPCAPCWKRSCQKATMCYDQVPLEMWISALDRGIQLVSQRDYSDSFSGGSSPQYSAAEKD